MNVLPDDEITRFAEELFERLWTERVELPRGEYGWVSVEHDDRTGELILVAHDGIYSGQLGIALYAAAMHRVTGKQRYRDVATDIAAVYAPFGRDKGRPIGYSNGLASLTYGYAVLGELLEKRQYLDQARKHTRRIAERVASEGSPADLLHGKAGVLLVLLSIYERTGSEAVLDRAHQVGDVLVADAEGPVQTNGWDLDTEIGMAHGHAGIAYALYRLASHSGDETFRTAADRAIAYENNHYSRTDHSWHASSSANHPRYAWCNGDAGIGAARAVSLQYTQSQTVRRDVERVYRGCSYELPPNDSLCHGAFSAAVFYQACTESDVYDLQQRVADIAYRVIQRDRRNGHLQLPFRDRTDLLPTALFSGISGVGYMLLRAVAPETIPAVALFE